MPYRIERVNQLIREEISELLRRQIKDPRLSTLVSITDVVTAPDLSFAKVYVSCFCTEEEKQTILRALASASNYIRGEMSRHLRLRHVPELSFFWDESIERGARISELIDRVCANNKPSNPDKPEPNPKR